MGLSNIPQGSNKTCLFLSMEILLLFVAGMSTQRPFPFLVAIRRLILQHKHVGITCSERGDDPFKPPDCKALYGDSIVADSKFQHRLAL